MDSRRRAFRLVVLACLVATVLATTAMPAEARNKRLDLHRGSRGHAVTLVEARLARIGLLPRSAVDRRYRAATVKAVKRFQRAHGLRANGRTNRRTWNAILTVYSRAIAPRPAPGWVRPSWGAPGITAHRGGSSESPENTLASIKHGVAVGADVVEFDVRTTSDGVFVLMHDATLDRTTDCTGAVSSKTLAQLASCRTDRGKQPIPTFDDVATYLATTSGVDLAPELKDVGTTALTDAELDRFVATIDDNGLASRTFVQSFDPAVFPRVRTRDAALRLVWLSNSVLYVSAIKARGVDVASVNMSALARQNVLVYHEQGVPIWTWTAQSRTDLERAWSLGVDSVGTDIPTTAASLYR
jgi:glycerophosphoryl diester phosphodiesterase